MRWPAAILAEQVSLSCQTSQRSDGSDDETVVGKSVSGKTAEELSADFRDAGTTHRNRALHRAFPERTAVRAWED
jgi:hypothetical protein